MKSFTKHKTAVIIGAGPAGLTAAYELLKRTDIIPIVVEESSQIGGIARTINHNGNRMDIGGHRFFSKNDDIMNWWLNILPLQGAPAIDEILTGTATTYSGGPDPETAERVMLSRRRISHIVWRNKFFNYPVEPSLEMLRNMGFATSLKVAASFARAHIFRRSERSLEDFYINRFGKQLYRMFFENYTTKVWGKHPSQLNADWGAQRVNNLSLASVLKNMLHKPSSDIEQKGVEKSLINRFIYPKYGPGQLWETVAHAIEDMGGTIITNCCAFALNCDENNLMKSVTVKHKNGETQTINCDYVFSSMPLIDLVAGIRGIEVPTEVCDIANHLPYRDFITIGVLVNDMLIKNTSQPNTYAGRIADTWFYIHNPNVKMGRLQVFNNWSPYLVDDYKNTVWLGLEYFCTEGDDMWNMSDEQLTELARRELSELHFIAPQQPVIDSHVERVKKAYPAYHGTYNDLHTLTHWLDGIGNLYCIGRNGQHRYNNMDHSMLTAIEAVNNIVSGKTSHSNVWNVNTDSSYHESK